MGCYQQPCLQLATRIATHVWTCQLQRVIRQFFLNFVLISILLSFTLRGFHFISLHCYVLHAASEVVKGLLDLPSPLVGRQEAFYCRCIGIGLFSDSPQQWAPHQSVVSQVLTVAGESWDASPPLSKPQGQEKHEAGLCSFYIPKLSSSSHFHVLYSKVNVPIITCQLQDALPDAPCASVAHRAW